MPAGGPDVITACNVKGETSSLPPGYLTSLLVAVPIAGSRFSEGRDVQKALGLSLGGYLIGENQGLQAVFFSGKYSEGPFS